jgi:hypothetical protein
MSLRRTVPVGRANGITRLTTGDYVATRDVGEVEELVFLSPLGEPLGLSRDSAIMCGDVGACTISRRRFLVPDIEGSFWTIRRSFRYELEHRDRRGALRKSLRPQREWFAPFDSLRRLSPGVEPQPEIVGGWAQGNHLFVAGNRSDSAWRQAGWERQRLPEGRSGASTTRVLDPNQLFDGWIEVVDTLTGTAIATAHVPLRLIGVAAPGYVFAARVDTDGFYEVVIYAVRLLPAQAPGRSVPEAWISSLEGQQRD